MTALDHVLQLSPDDTFLLKQTGAGSVELLAQAEEKFLVQALAHFARKHGLLPPPPPTVRGWIYQCQKAVGKDYIMDADDAPDVEEAISLDDVPEVIIEGRPSLPLGRRQMPDIVGAPPPARTPRKAAPPTRPEQVAHFPEINHPATKPAAIAAVPPAAKLPPLEPQPQIPAFRKEPERPELPAAPNAPVSSMAPAAPATQLPAPRPAAAAPAVSLAPQMDPNLNTETNDHSPRRKFQSFNEYSEGARGIVPLARRESPMAPDAEDTRRADGKLSRTAKRGVVYPHPGSAVLGALISLAWRVVLVASLIAVPYIVFTHQKGSPPPTREVLPWILGLVVLGTAQLIILNRVRCRICTCHLFYSRRCTKNSKAHRPWFLGYVGALSLHLLTFQWFRCMYCGTAIRLTGDNKPQDD